MTSHRLLILFDRRRGNALVLGDGKMPDRYMVHAVIDAGYVKGAKTLAANISARPIGSTAPTNAELVVYAAAFSDKIDYSQHLEAKVVELE
ncbi:MAG: hypothetical protein GY903_17000 [Fuerstiella sp.]|nr:hypothetical protein [Fuerstiella sp.]MCP4856182.1 hypothetical protein [Fuerstiella sp.]